MKPRYLTLIIAVALLALLASPAPVAAQAAKGHNVHRHYELIDLGTFGGPASYVNNPSRVINNRGVVAGYADTSTPDPFPSFCFNPDCFVSHAFQWQKGELTDLGTLKAGWSSQTTWISDTGKISGWSENGAIDPLLGLPEFRAVLWQHGQITNLGTLEGGFQSFGLAVNNGGQVAGIANNKIPDPYCLQVGFCKTQTRAFLWRSGVMRDLGTLGGPDAFAFVLNDHNQVAGYSYTNSTPNSVTDMCGANVPTADPFLWDHATMRDLGTLGGTCGMAFVLNNRGQIVGQSDMAGDRTHHPYLWTKPGPMRDLGTLGGDNGQANWINDTGEVVGNADLPGSKTHDASLWTKGGITDLGTLPGDSCSNAYQVNSRGQVVGTSEHRQLCNARGEHAFLWEHGGPMVDLNTLVPPAPACICRSRPI